MTAHYLLPRRDSLSLGVDGILELYKDDAEVLDQDLNWSRYLNRDSSEVISSSTWTTTNGVSITSSSFSAPIGKTTVKFSGSNGILKNTVVTNLGNTFIQSIRVIGVVK